MPTVLQNQPQIKFLPAFSVDERLRLREADINDVVKTVQGILPQHVDEDIDVTITFVEKNMKTMADMPSMEEALTHLVGNTLDAMPGCGKFPLTINQVNFNIESLLNADYSIIGACAFISLAGVCKYISGDEKMEENLIKPFFITKTTGNGLGLAIAYRIIRKSHGRVKVNNRTGQGTEVSMYLPLTNVEIVNMMSIPAE